ncbi:MAG: hypothetical protein NVS3B20_03130 [Polyangiales bacterium]
MHPSLKRDRTLRYLSSLLAVGYLTACFSHKLDAKKVEAAIRDALEGKEVVLKSLHCPDQRPLRKGDTFDCQGETHEGQAITFTVQQRDSEGNIKWHLDGALVNEAKLGDLVEAKLGDGADIRCPSKVILLKKGETFTCDVEFRGKTRRVQLFALDDDGKVETTFLEPGDGGQRGSDH